MKKKTVARSIPFAPASIVDTGTESAAPAHTGPIAPLHKVEIAIKEGETVPTVVEQLYELICNTPDAMPIEGKPGRGEVKDALRELLMTPYAYDFGQGVVTGLTLQQVFCRLYDEWVAVKQVWAKLQEAKQAELAQEYSGPSAADDQNRQNAYLIWYATASEGYLKQINERYGEILEIFAPSDLKILEEMLEMIRCTNGRRSQH